MYVIKKVAQNYLFISGFDRSGCHGFTGVIVRVAVLWPCRPPGWSVVCWVSNCLASVTLGRVCCLSCVEYSHLSCVIFLGGGNPLSSILVSFETNLWEWCNPVLASMLRSSTKLFWTFLGSYVQIWTRPPAGLLPSLNETTSWAPTQFERDHQLGSSPVWTRPPAGLLPSFHHVW